MFDFLNVKRGITIGWQCLREDATTLLHARSTRGLTVVDKERLGCVKRMGYHVIRGYLPRDQCASLVAIVDRLIADYPDRLQIDPEQSDHRVWGAERAAAEILSFSRDPYLLRLAAAYLRTEATTLTTLAAKLVARPNSKGSGGGWHRDSMFESQFKAILYLSDVGAENGPFQYVPGSHGKLNVLRTVPITRPPNEKDFEDAELQDWLSRRRARVDTLPGQAGDVIIVDTRGIHRGEPIRAAARYALTNYFFPSHKRGEMQAYFGPLLKF